MTDSASKKRERCECSEWDCVERKLPDGTEYHYFQCKRCFRTEYPIPEAQKLMEYSESHLFFFISDWILVWLYAGNGAPVSGIIYLQKQLFILFYEFAQENDIPTENPGFRAYKFGPYTERIDHNLKELMNLGLVASEGRLNTANEKFFLTANGVTEAKKLFEKLSLNQQANLADLRRNLQQFDSEGIVRYVYKKYPEFTDKSVILDRIVKRRR